jgi:homeobox protein cut-like
MGERVQQIIQLWKDFDLNNYQRELDKTASEIADRQDRSETSRKKLIELSKKFKKESSEEARKEVAELLKSFQTEVDSLIGRSKAAEVAFLGTYKALLDLPDPTPALSQLSSFQERAGRIVELENENQRLKSRNQEYEEEFQVSSYPFIVFSMKICANLS